MNKVLVAIVVVAVILISALIFVTNQPDQGPQIYPEVWSGVSPRGEHYEFKVNCAGAYSKLEECFLYNLDAVRVIGPNGTTYQLNKDFNINSYSGEVTRRWVLYGPEGSGLPSTGEYKFEFVKNGEVILTKTVKYEQSKISYPTEVRWERRGKDMLVEWSPPVGVNKGMWYKVIVWNVQPTPDMFISKVFPWDAKSGTLENVPLAEGGNYSLNVAVFFSGGYAYSDYVILTW